MAKKPNALAAVRMMVESEDEEEEDDTKSISNEEFLRLHFDSYEPEQPVKSILKRKEPKADSVVENIDVPLTEKEERNNVQATTLNDQIPALKELASDHLPLSKSDADGDNSAAKAKTGNTATNETEQQQKEDVTAAEKQTPPFCPPSPADEGKNNSGVTSHACITDAAQKSSTSAGTDDNSLPKESDEKESAKETKALVTNKEPAKRFIIRIMGLTANFAKRDLLMFFGVWPVNGSDGVRKVTNSNGIPNGFAYIELERQQDKTDVLRMSGMHFDGKKIKTQLSSDDEMERDWATTLRASKEIEESQFVRLSKLNTTSSKEDIVNALSSFNLKEEDVYCVSADSNNGTVFIAAQTPQMAEKICSESLSIGDRRVEAEHVHPNLFSNWCFSNNVKQKAVDPKPDTAEKKVVADLHVDEKKQMPQSAPSEKTPKLEKGSKDTKNENTNSKPSTREDSADITQPQLSNNMPPMPNGPFPMPPMRHHFMPGRMPMMGPPRMMPFGPGGRPMGPPGMMPMRPPGMRPMGPRGFPPTIYMRMYNLPEQATAQDIKEFFAPVVPAKIAQNTGYNIFDIDFYTPEDNMMAIRRQGMLIRKNAISMEMLPGPPIPLPPRIHIPKHFDKKAHKALGRPEQREPPPVNSQKLREYSPKRRGYSPTRREFSPKRMEYSPKRREYSPKRREYSPKGRVYSPKGREYSPKRKEYSPKRREYIPKRRNYSPNRREYSPKRREFSPKRRDFSPKRRGYSPRRKSPGKDYCYKRGRSRWEEKRNDKSEKRQRPDEETIPGRCVETIEVDPFPEEDPFKYRLPPFDANKPAGQCAIQTMEGYFCQICRKFYNSKTAGKVTHCKTRGHYDKLKEHLAELRRKQGAG